MIDFKWHRFEQDIILLCLRLHLAFPLSYRNQEEIMDERGAGRSYELLPLGSGIYAAIGS
jgi:transposase-like protein